MATEARDRRSGRRRDRGRVPYRLTVAQVLAMREHGIPGDEEDVEPWGGVLYRMVKHERHDFGVSVTAEALRPLVPAESHGREEKSSRQEPHHLPKPDLAVARGPLRACIDAASGLEPLALVVEVCDSTRHDDFVARPRRYARAGIPVYCWVVDLRRRRAVVFGEPRALGRHHEYAVLMTYGPGDAADVVMDGVARGRIAVDDLLPPPAAVT